MIALCKHFGLAFETNAIGGTNSINLTFKRISITCPRCGQWADLLEDTYNFDQYGNATLVSGPPLSISIINAIKNIAEKAQKENYSK
ncbi:MAG TPA: hypothetical protein VM888_13360 [Chitinophagaceae bacterium]|jgi:hypothetical protein|nr:hypothetical protein [Chitinophagaceae bacterium]